MSDGSYHFSVGAFECTVVMDGTHTYEHPAQLFFLVETLSVSAGRW